MHIPVLLKETIDFLGASGGGLFFDGTLGLAGHGAAILGANPANHLYATDKDQDIIDRAREKLSTFPHRFTLFHSDFKELASLNIEMEKIDGFLFDLGVSSVQLDDPQKGFSYAREAPLDMRMNKTQEFSAADIVNDYSHQQLSEIFKNYGEFRDPSPLVHQLIYHRREKRIETTEELKTIVRRVWPQRKTMDPLARVFQALRIEVNGELAGLEDFILRLCQAIKPGARVVVISFHSLEDRMVKNAFKRAKQNDWVDILTRKPVIACPEEIGKNPRSRSAKLRVAQKI